MHCSCQSADRSRRMLLRLGEDRRLDGGGQVLHAPLPFFTRGSTLAECLARERIDVRTARGSRGQRAINAARTASWGAGLCAAGGAVAPASRRFAWKTSREFAVSENGPGDGGRAIFPCNLRGPELGSSPSWCIFKTKKITNKDHGWKCLVFRLAAQERSVHRLDAASHLSGDALSWEGGRPAMPRKISGERIWDLMRATRRDRIPFRVGDRVRIKLRDQDAPWLEPELGGDEGEVVSIRRVATLARAVYTLKIRAIFHTCAYCELDLRFCPNSWTYRFELDQNDETCLAGPICIDSSRIELMRE
jgi:hypothetical protein